MLSFNIISRRPLVSAAISLAILVGAAFLAAQLTQGQDIFSVEKKADIDQTQKLDLYRTFFTGWAALMLFIPAFCYFLFHYRSKKDEDKWRAFWTASYIAFLVHVCWAAFFIFDGKWNAITNTPRLSAALLDTVVVFWWGVDVVLAWWVRSKIRWISNSRIAFHLLLFVLFFLGAVVQGELIVSRILFFIAMTSAFIWSFRSWLKNEINKNKLNAFTAKLSALVVYCSPAILALIILVFTSYKQKTEDVSKEIKGIAVFVASTANIEESSLWKSLKDDSVLKEIIDYFAFQKKNNRFGKTFMISELTLQEAGVPDSISSKLNSLKNIDITGVTNFDGQVQAALGNTPQDTLTFHRYAESIKKNAIFKGPTVNEIDDKVFDVWMVNTFIITFMVLLPYLILGFRLAFGPEDKIQLLPADRVENAFSRWPMKFVIAIIITIGWIYIVNPLGRGATTMKAYLISVDILSLGETLPIYISPTSVSHVVAGFIGWYLYLLTYFFNKLFHNDVFGTRVYRFLFGKFLFTYGAALVLSAFTKEADAKLGLFLIGFFPLSAVTILKQYGQKAGKGEGMGSANLGDLLSLDPKNVLRLEEEGIDSITTLANTKSEYLKQYLPVILRNAVDEWIDKAQLHAVLGAENYARVSKVCVTASEFLRREQADYENFKKDLKDSEVKNLKEIAHLLNRRFGKKLIEKPKKTSTVENSTHEEEPKSGEDSGNPESESK